MNHLSYNSPASLVTAVVVLTVTRIIKSVVTGQTRVTLEWNNTPGKKKKQKKVVHAYLIPGKQV